MTERTGTRSRMSERQLQTAVIETARLLSWRVAHFRPAQTGKGWRTPVEGDAAGFPDLILVRGDRLLAVELKANGNKPSEAQIAWLEAFAKAGVEADVWDDTDWASGHVEARLRGEERQ